MDKYYCNQCKCYMEGRYIGDMFCYICGECGLHIDDKGVLNDGSVVIVNREEDER